VARSPDQHAWLRRPRGLRSGGLGAFCSPGERLGQLNGLHSGHDRARLRRGVKEQLYVAVDAAQQQVACSTPVLDGAPSVDDVTMVLSGVHGKVTAAVDNRSA
jgi:hypothetical protein